MKYLKFSHAFFGLAVSVLLSACGTGGPYPGVPELVNYYDVPVLRGKIAPPQITYRIDENRYFEYVPDGAGACTDATVYYNDREKGIHSPVIDLDSGVMGDSDFVIDAANDQYLIGPVSQGNTDCSSGGGTCGGYTMPYSIDGGKTWKRAEILSASSSMTISGSMAYEMDRDKSGSMVDIAIPPPPPEKSDFFYPDGSERVYPKLKKFPTGRDWINFSKKKLVIKKDPIDTRFHCVRNGKE